MTIFSNARFNEYFFADSCYNYFAWIFKSCNKNCGVS